MGTRTVTPILLEGPPRERGRQYGTQARAAIREAVHRFKYQIRHVSGLDPDAVRDRFIATTTLLAAVRSLTPHLAEELGGMEDTTGLPFEDLFLLQCQDEIQWWYRAMAGAAPGAGELCSTLGAGRTATQPTYVAQNLDHLGIYDGLECLLRIRHAGSDLECLVPSFAGLLGLNGLSSRGVAIVCNTLHKHLQSRPDGLGVTFLQRAVLEQPDLASALAYLRATLHASAQSYIVGDPGAVVCVECSANAVAPYAPVEGLTRTWHTNHPLASHDLLPSPLSPEQSGTTYGRCEYLARRLGDPSQEVDLEAIRYILSSHQGTFPLCVHHGFQPDRSYTLASVICVLGERPEMHLTLGPPCQSEYQVFGFD